MADFRPPAWPAVVPADADPVRRMLDGKLAAARRAILFERLWPALVAPAAVVALFLGASWLGLWTTLPHTWRGPALVPFALLLLASLWPLLRVRLGSRAEAQARLDRDSGVAHRPVEAALDRSALATPEAQALFRRHQQRALDRVAGIVVRAPDPALRRLDGRALRFAPAMLMLAGLFAATPDLVSPVASAFDWTRPLPHPAPPRLDAWVDPPSYTGRAPQFLVRSDRAGASVTEVVTVPVGSTLVVRAAPAHGVTLGVTGGLEGVGPQESGEATMERRFRLTAGGEAIVRRGDEPLARFAFEVIPDRAPRITLGEIRPSEDRESLRFAFTVEDDYGVKEARAVLAPVRGPGALGRRTLVPAPDGALPLPYGARTGGEGEGLIALKDHHWAGGRVRLKLQAEDDIGQGGESEARELILPQRAFSDPLARALVEQRRALVFDPDHRAPVQLALDALMVAPERFTPKTGVYLGLRKASTMLRRARTDPQLVEVADWLYAMAVDIEDGGLSEAEKALRQAQERLREALERGASPDEVKRLTDQLRRAMDNYMRELAERALRDQQNARNQPQDSQNQRLVRPDDFRRMLEEIERLSREGRHAEAQQMLEQLRRMMENLQIARGRQQMDPREQGLNQAMDELDRLTREQQELRDRTFRDGQQRQGNRAQRPGQQGQRGQQPGQRGQQGQQGQGEQQAEGGEGGQGLQDGQRQLRDRLAEMRRRLRELGLNPEQGLGDAEQAMREAEGQLGQGQPGRAVESQGRALEGLRRGMQGMAQQMQQDGEGGEHDMANPRGDDPGRPGQPRAGSEARNDDPLGRPTRSREALDGRTRIPGANETAAEQARRVLEELRRRLGEPLRPRLELEYFERLLPRN